MSIETLENKISALVSQLEDLETKRIIKQDELNNMEIDPYDYEGQYTEMLDEASNCCSLCKDFGAARILRELDPIGYRCGLLDFVDGTFNIEDTEEYKDLESEIEDLESEIEDLESEIEDLESEIEDLEHEN